MRNPQIPAPVEPVAAATVQISGTTFTRRADTATALHIGWLCADIGKNFRWQTEVRALPSARSEGMVGYVPHIVDPVERARPKPASANSLGASGNQSAGHLAAIRFDPATRPAGSRRGDR